VFDVKGVKDMTFIESMKEKARKDIKTIVLPEGNDIRTLQAVEKVRKEGFADVIVLGDKNEIIDLAKKNNVNIEGVKIITPVEDSKFDELVNEFYEIRKLKGMTPEKARETLKDET
jgi:phosphate acetyltransferase